MAKIKDRWFCNRPLSPVFPIPFLDTRYRNMGSHYKADNKNEPAYNVKPYRSTTSKTFDIFTSRKAFKEKLRINLHKIPKTTEFVKILPLDKDNISYFDLVSKSEDDCKEEIQDACKIDNRSGNNIKILQDIKVPALNNVNEKACCTANGDTKVQINKNALGDIGVFELSPLYPESRRNQANSEKLVVNSFDMVEPIVSEENSQSYLNTNMVPESSISDNLPKSNNCNYNLFNVHATSNLNKNVMPNSNLNSQSINLRIHSSPKDSEIIDEPSSTSTPEYDSDADPLYQPSDFESPDKKGFNIVQNRRNNAQNDNDYLWHITGLENKKCNGNNKEEKENKNTIRVEEDNKANNENNTDILENENVKKNIRKTDFCYFCETDVNNFARHIQRNHSFETDVQKILLLPLKSKERKESFNKLRRQGNYLKVNSSNPKPVRQAIKSVSLIPCIYCLGLYAPNQLYRHRKRCFQNPEKKKISPSDGQTKLALYLKPDKNLIEKVFPHMRADKISLVAKKDQLICAFGARYLKVHRESHFVPVVSRKMRELARILIELRKTLSHNITFFDALKPENFYHFVNASKICAEYDQDLDVFKSPTFALNIATSIKQCCEIATDYCINKKAPYTNVDTSKIVSEIQLLTQQITSNWRFEVSTQAANDLNLKKFNKISIIPLASDLKILKSFLIKKALHAVQILESQSIENEKRQAFNLLMETIYCRLILFNRKRPGELQRMYLHTYKNSENEQSYEEFENIVTPTEKILLQTFKRIVIRGKRGRGVPVLFSRDIQDHLEISLKYRDTFVAKNNPFLFALANLEINSHIVGYKVLQKFSKACGAKNPKALTSTRLRKHLATLTQIFTMSENDLEQLATFMGHTLAVHKNSYRLPDDIYQTAKISKLLTLMETGKAEHFKGKALDEIDLNLEEDLLENTEDDSDKDKEDDIPIEEDNPLNESLLQTQENVLTPENKKNKSIVNRTTWTNEQKNVVKEYFKNHLKQKRAPKRYECNELFEKHPNLLADKNWLKVKVFIQNCYSNKYKH